MTNHEPSQISSNDEAEKDKAIQEYKERVQKDADRLPFDMLSEAELLEKPTPPTLWAHDYLVPIPGVLAISGPWESYKTMLTLWLMRRAVAGKKSFDEDLDFIEHNKELKPVERAGNIRCLFIEDEMSESNIKERIMLMQKRVGTVKDMYYIIGKGLKANDPKHMEELMALVKHFGINWICFDPFSSCSGVYSENDNAEISAVMDNLRALSTETNSCVSFIHHPSKGDKLKTSLRGAGDISGKVDMHLTIERENKESNEIIIHFEKMRIANRQNVSSFRLAFNGDDLTGSMGFKYLGTTKTRSELRDEDYEKLKQNICALLVDNPGWSREMIASTLGEKPGGSSRFGRAWTELKDEKIIQKDGHGKWNLT